MGRKSGNGNALPKLQSGDWDPNDDGRHQENGLYDRLVEANVSYDTCLQLLRVLDGETDPDDTEVQSVLSTVGRLQREPLLEYLDDHKENGSHSDAARAYLQAHQTRTAEEIATEVATECECSAKNQ